MKNFEAPFALLLGTCKSVFVVAHTTFRVWVISV